MKSIILIGDFHEIRELIKKSGYVLTGIVGEIKFDNNTSLNNWLSDIDFINKSDEKRVFISPDDPTKRKCLYELYKSANFNVVSISCPTATISESAKLGEFYCIQTNVNISSNVIIGNGVKINTYANIMHDCIIGDFTTIAPNAVILGNCIIGEQTYIGANSTILPGIDIGNNVIVGAGSVVTKNIPQDTIVVGNPARTLRKNI